MSHSVDSSGLEPDWVCAHKFLQPASSMSLALRTTANKHIIGLGNGNGSGSVHIEGMTLSKTGVTGIGHTGLGPAWDEA